jgi:glucarate dehydratase
MPAIPITPGSTKRSSSAGAFSSKMGAVVVPDAPGLGVELDRAMLAKLHAQYQRAGLERRNDEIEMQKVNPGWKFEATRW